MVSDKITLFNDLDAMDAFFINSPDLIYFSKLVQNQSW